MFRTGSPYSPFFTSGLLSEPSMCTPSSSRSVSPEVPAGPRRGSLPTDAPLTRNNSQATTQAKSSDESSAFYFTLQPKRDTSEFRSFLSLDLAESQSLRSVSLKRKFSNATKRTSGLSKAGKAVLSQCFQIPEHKAVSSSHLAPASSSLRMRLSRDSLRGIPSPKPAPSATLPDVPTSPTSPSVPSIPPRLPSFTISSSFTFPAAPASTPAPASSPFLISRTPTPPITFQLPKRSVTITSSSTVSTTTRKVNRSDALARLEGRVAPVTPVTPKPIGRNFMNMDDDEDDEDDEVLFRATYEPEDIVLPPATPKRASLQSSVSSRRRTDKKDWFPLNSFIDLHKDDDETSTWNWRSFIEIASVS